MAWFLLFIAGLMEVLWAYSMKLSNGFTNIAPTLVTIIAMTASIVLLSLAMRSIPLGTAYVIWTGIGAIGAFLVGIFFLGEHASATRIIAATLIVCGLLLIKFSES